MKNNYITHHHIISPLGFGSESNFKNLTALKSGIQKHKRQNGDFFYSSIVDKEKINNLFSKIGDINLHTTLEKMMILSVQDILKKSKLTITNKTGLIISTTKGNIDVLSPESNFYKDKKRMYLSELGKQIQYFFKFLNEAIVLSNACVSGVLALSVADRLIKSNMYDNIIIVSGDLVTEFIVSGFTSFQAISDQPCKPFSKNRTGITIGEAIASVLISSTISKIPKSTAQIMGSGSCNDANHISGPSRTGEGLFLSIKSALKEAQVSEKEIDYISAHGTATNFNDEMESIAFSRLQMLDIPLNSLKGYYGHTLGSSGLLETIIGIESLYQNTLVASLGFDELGVSHPINIIKKTEQKEINIFLKTASGFGGCNTAIILKK
ncbi:MAG: beta-ketoacyl synthase [Flavobacteriaceae bacterium]|nr:beta-ketoacyl synthase [Flavobacteriaceae bacterium]